MAFITYNRAYNEKGKKLNIINIIMAFIGVTIALIIGSYVVDRVYFAYINFCKTWGNGTFETNLVSGSWERINCTAWNIGDIVLYSDTYNYSVAD